MPLWNPDPTFYPSARLAMQAPAERHAFVSALNPKQKGSADAICVVDVAADSPTYGTVVGRVEMPNEGDEVHHFGWNACSSALCPYAPHPHVERRYLLVPGLRSSRLHVIDTKPDPRKPKIVKVIEPETVASRAGYSRLHTVHCAPDGIYVDRGPQQLAYDFAWHLGYDTLLTSEWGTPNMVENGLNPELLVGGKYGHSLHVWDLRKRKHLQALDLGAEQQMVLELRPAHDPTKAYGFVGVVVSIKDLSASIWVWHLKNGAWAIKKVIEIPPEPADASKLPPALQPFKAVPPLVTDIELSLDDKFLYVSCWGTGELRQYDVSDPFNPRLAGTVRMGGIVSHAPHAKGGELNGGPQMVEVSRDGRRVYLTNSLYASWDAQFYPEGIRGWMAKVDANQEGGISVDPEFFVPFEGERPHQVRLEGGDASSDSYCYP